MVLKAQHICYQRDICWIFWHVQHMLFYWLLECCSQVETKEPLSVCADLYLTQTPLMSLRSHAGSFFLCAFFFLFLFFFSWPERHGCRWETCVEQAGTADWLFSLWLAGLHQLSAFYLLTLSIGAFSNTHLSHSHTLTDVALLYAVLCPGTGRSSASLELCSVNIKRIHTPGQWDTDQSLQWKTGHK